jgi:hypothetical protein
MTDQNETSDQVPELYGIVEAFLDGELVDPSALRAALADRGARDHFVDLVVIRGAVHGLDSLVMHAGTRPQGPLSRGKWLAAAAAALAVSVTAGYAAGQRAIASSDAPSTVEAVIEAESVPVAPPPTRSIAFKPGVNWTDSSGGR